MSRNLLSKRCHFCMTEPVLQELPRPLHPSEGKAYFHEFEGLIVADAKCPVCCAKYLAWIDERQRMKAKDGDPIFKWHSPRFVEEGSETPFFDLSFRSTFNDEPGEEDLPNPKAQAALDYANRRGYYEALEKVMSLLLELQKE